MAVPLDGIRAIHNAFRKDMTAMDQAAYAAAGGHGSLDLVSKRYTFFNQVLAWHAKGEEEDVFPIMENVAPLVAEAYERDHRGLDKAFEALDRAIKASAPLQVCRATSAFDFHLSIHLSKEEAHLYRIFNDKVSLPDQGVAIGKITQKIPQERFPEVIDWLYPLMAPDDRENMTRLWKQGLPGPVFAQATKRVRQVIGSGWEDLVRRIPDLT